MNDLVRMKKLAGINEWDDEWEDETEESGPTSLYLLEVVVQHEGRYFAGIYSSQELASAAKSKLTSGKGGSAQITQVELDGNPSVKYF
jgi:hypothetical protein